MHRLATTIYWLALVAWLAAIVAGAATAMAAFSSLPALKVAVPSAAQVYPGADEASSRFAAGYVAQSVFSFVDGVELVAMPVLAVTLLLQVSVFGWPGRSWANRARIASIVAAIVITTLQLTILAPRMATTLADYRSAVLQGDAQAAAEHKAAFDRDHVKADPMLRTSGALLLLGLVLSAWTLTPRRPGPRGDVQAPRVHGRGGRG